ncbi:MAG: hypothetical protein U9Q81_01115 [Pseudomonadota bacterium]|nr:hypothetical protein [Pseudomonadota bacterium]
MSRKTIPPESLREILEILGSSSTDTVAPGQTIFNVEQLVEAEPALTVGGVRHDLFHRTTNGLEASGAVIRRGRRILLHREKYLEWLTKRGRRCSR